MILKKERSSSLKLLDFSPKHRYWKNQNDHNPCSKVLVIEYCDLRFICNLVLAIWDLNYIGACNLDFSQNTQL
jgi:hypothetical protein